MARPAGELLLVATLDPVRVGELYRHVPPHVTVLPWFQLLPGRRDAFHQRMDDIAEENLPLRLAGVSVEQFGEQRDTAVTRLGGVALGFHFGAFALVEALEGKFDRTYTDFDYVPHISHTPERRVAVDEELILSTAQLFERLHDGRKQVIRTYGREMEV